MGGVSQRLLEANLDTSETLSFRLYDDKLVPYLTYSTILDYGVRFHFKPIAIFGAKRIVPHCSALDPT